MSRVYNMPWFNQNAAECADDDIHPDLPMRTHGCGICAASAALFALFGTELNPADLRQTLDARAGDIVYLDGDGVYWPAFTDVMARAFPALRIQQ